MNIFTQIGKINSVFYNYEKFDHPIYFDEVYFEGLKGDFKLSYSIHTKITFSDKTKNFKYLCDKEIISVEQSMVYYSWWYEKESYIFNLSDGTKFEFDIEATSSGEGVNYRCSIEIYIDDVNLNSRCAITKIQKIVRGFLTREKYSYQKKLKFSSNYIKSKVNFNKKSNFLYVYLYNNFVKNNLICESLKQDFKINQYNVHSLVLNSKYFVPLLIGGFNEKKSIKIHFSDDAISLLIEYLYIGSFNYTNVDKKIIEELFLISDQYMFDDLKKSLEWILLS